MPTVLATGCDSGLGREFALQYAQAGYAVWATYRDLQNALPAQPSLRNCALDVTDMAQFAALKETLGDTPIDVLVSNAGIGMDTAALEALDIAYVQRMLATNTVGPLKLVQTLVDNVAASQQRRIVFVSSRMGSITLNLSGGHYGYRASKAALNAIGRSLAIDLFRRGITLVMLHPGSVMTAGAGPQAPLTATQSVLAMRATLARLGNHETGVFYTYDGHPLPW
ncbi:MAG: SDR family oxidoreductase [Burkholderiaceae bacterium]